MDGNSKYILRTKDLKAYYVLDDPGQKKKTVKAVDNVNLNIRKNEIYGIAGESGCGKTSLMKTLYAFIKPPLRLMDGQGIILS